MCVFVCVVFFLCVRFFEMNGLTAGIFLGTRVRVSMASKGCITMQWSVVQETQHESSLHSERVCAYQTK